MKINPVKRCELADREWRVYSVQKFTLDVITDYMMDRLSQDGRSDLMTEEILYRNSVLTVYVVNFLVVEYLVTNKHAFGMKLDFECFSRESRGGRWRKWKEEKRTPKEKVRALIRTKQIKTALQITKR